MATTKTVAVSRIYFDPQNPRHEPIATEAEILAHLVNIQDVRPLARHIAHAGSTSPLELMALVPHPTVKDRYIVAEGNRRLCALKLLLDPDKAPGEKEKRYFRSLQKHLAKPIKSVEAVVFPDMESTRPWVALRHDGEQGGIGTKAWKANQSTRFNLLGSGNSPNAQALHLIDYATRRQLISDSDVSEFGITTLTRYLSNPIVRSALGLADNRSIAITVPESEFELALTTFLQDALGESPKVHSRSSAPERKAYGESLHAAGIAPTTRGLPPYVPNPSDHLPSPSTAQHGAAKDLKAKVQRQQRNRDDDRCVVPPGFAADIDDPVFQRLFRELRTLKADDFTFAATYLLRAVIEQATTLFLRKHGGGMPKELHLKLQKSAEKLEAQGYQGKGLQALRKMSSDVDSRYSPDTIGMFIHGSAVPTKVNAIRTWDTFQPIMVEFVRQLA